MKISSYQTANINSLRQALNISNLKRVMNQDAQSVDNLIKTMERSVTPHKGGNVDIEI
jgi:hypothetical protein